MTRWLFDLGWFALIAFVAGTAELLPEFVGDAGKELPRDRHVALMLGLAIVAPWLATRGAVWFGRRFPSALNVPHKDYWFAPERSEQSFDRLQAYMFRLGLGLLALLAALHYDALAGAQRDWPQPLREIWIAGAIALAAGFAIWIVRLNARFHAPPVEAPVAAAARRWTRSDELVWREDQPLWALVWLTPPMLALPLLTPGGADLPVVALATVVAAWLIVIAVMGRLVVELHGDRLEWRYGWLGRPRWRLPLDEIAKVEIVRSRPLEGWGIRVTGQGMLYNAHGLDAVRIVRRDGRMLRLGTREPQRLAAALSARL